MTKVPKSEIKTIEREGSVSATRSVLWLANSTRGISLTSAKTLILFLLLASIVGGGSSESAFAQAPVGPQGTPAKPIPRGVPIQDPVAKTPAVVVPPVIRRILPPITHPELLQPNRQPHIFVTTSPNRAFRIGEQVLLTVNAFDSKTGAQLALPVTVGNARGITSKLIPLRVDVSSTQRCGLIGGQQFCLNVLKPPMGTVVVPPDRYPGGGGNFTLSVVLPTLLVGLAGSPILRPGTETFVVSAVDGRTHLPVPGAQVLVDGKLLGPANRPITYPLHAVAPLRARSRLGLETLPASFGPVLIVRAPGYSDQVVHYVLSSAL